VIFNIHRELINIRVRYAKNPLTPVPSTFIRILAQRC